MRFGDKSKFRTVKLDRQQSLTEEGRGSEQLLIKGSKCQARNLAFYPEKGRNMEGFLCIINTAKWQKLIQVWG